MSRQCYYYNGGTYYDKGVDMLDIIGALKLKQNWNETKFIFIYDLNDHGHHNVCVICIQEIWISDPHDNSFFQLEGCNFISQAKTSFDNGGVGIYLLHSRTAMNYNYIQVPKSGRVFLLKLNFKNKISSDTPNK